MNEKSSQQLFSYSKNDFCIEGEWVTDCSEAEDELVKSPPFFYHDTSFVFSFYFRTTDTIFTMFVDAVKNIKELNYPVSIEITFQNLDEKKSLFKRGTFRFSPSTKRAIIAFNDISSFSVFDDGDFSIDGRFHFLFKIFHRKAKKPKELSLKPLFYQIQSKYNYCCSVSNSPSVFQNKFLKSLLNIFFPNTNQEPIKNQNNLKNEYFFKNEMNFSNESEICCYVGLNNQGATCYLNSLLQSLFHLPAFRSIVYKMPLENVDQKRSVVFNLQKLFSLLENSDVAVSTKDLTNSFGWTNQDSFMQHDVQELCRVLLDNLEKKMPNNMKTAISDLFQFQMCQHLKCINVDYENVNVENYFDLTLEVKGCKDIYESIEKLLAPEKLDELYETEKFGKQEAIIFSSIKNLPPVLQIHLKRFKFESNIETKVNDKFIFPKELDMSRFVNQNDLKDNKREENSRSDINTINDEENKIENDIELFESTEKPKNKEMSTESEENQFEKYNQNQETDVENENPNQIIGTKEDTPETEKSQFEVKNENENKSDIQENKTENIENVSANEKNDAINDYLHFEKSKNEEKLSNDDYLYELFGVLVHQGNAFMGHYFAYLRPTPNHKWFKFNDSTVSHVTEFEAIDKNFGDKKINSSGYMLIYVKKSEIPKIFTCSACPPKFINLNELSSQSANKDLIANQSDDFDMKTIKEKDSLMIKLVTEDDLRKDCVEYSLLSNCNSGTLVIKKKVTYNKLLQRISDFFQTEEDKMSVFRYGADGAIGEQFQKNDELICWFGQQKLSVFCRLNSLKNNIKSNELIIFLKVFDGNSIKFYKTLIVKQKKKVVKSLRKDIKNYFGPNVDIKKHILLFARKCKTLFYRVQQEWTFQDNKLYNGCILVMQNIITNPAKDINSRYSKPINTIVNNEDNLEIKIDYPIFEPSMLFYIDSKYNMCDAIVSEYDFPTKKLFYLRFCFNTNLPELKRIVANAANIDYDPSKSAIMLYTQHLNSPDEPNLYPLNPNSTKFTEPIKRLFFRFFRNTAENKMSTMTPIKMRISNGEIFTVLGSTRETIKHVVNNNSAIITEKIFLAMNSRNQESNNQESYNQESNNQMSTINFEDFEFSLENNGSSLRNVSWNINVPSVNNNIIQINQRENLEENQKKIAVCHTSGVDMFVPFYFILNDKETFVDTKKRIFEIIKEKIDEKASMNLNITLRKMNNYCYDTHQPRSINNDDVLYQLADEKSFIFIEQQKPQKNVVASQLPAPKKYGVVINN
ncbi:hypothetical protein TRFO_28240 [Tritrichomonas foetus]|uniref:USP domain-containing protein n=1 Tax=Tritrichomonas foetus TaxID=1144522 RepID=A0A1J4K3H7_9EUKA|nr:hypothetical protein TRFO_28240 [Tritrichomonas foetus]|eukprot:OHT04300.1 hypothetical protein TRFO_28240 [Tritrichomonas foetus]